MDSKCSHCGVFFAVGQNWHDCPGRRRALTPEQHNTILRAKLAEAERQRDEAVKLLREWLNGHCSGIIRRDLTERTEAYIAGVPHG